MSLNTAHVDSGVLIHAGESILIFSENVSIEFSGQGGPEFRGTKTGRIYLTTHRMIFNSKSKSDPMLSFSFPFVALSEMGIEQPVFGANFIKGKVTAQPNGNWSGESKFKITFKSGGAIEFGQALMRVAQMATRGVNRGDAPPPYAPPTDPWYAAPPPAYTPAPQGYYGWVPPTNVFPNQPPTDSVFMSNAPPPYPGLAPQGPPPMQGAYPAYPPQQGYPAYPPQQGGYPPQQGNNPTYPPQQGGNPSYPPQYGQNPSYPPPPQGGYPGAQPSYPPHPSAGASAPSAPGFTDPKAAEAAQSAYYDPNRPQMAYVPPPAYYEQPPSYQDSLHKKDQ